MKWLTPVIVTSFILILACWFVAVWSYAEKIGHGSWNSNIFLWSSIGMLAAIVVFVFSLIILLIERLSRRSGRS